MTSGSEREKRSVHRDRIRADPYHGLPRSTCSGCLEEGPSCHLLNTCNDCGLSYHKQCGYSCMDCGADLCYGCLNEFGQDEDTAQCEMCMGQEEKEEEEEEENENEEEHERKNSKTTDTNALIAE